MLCTPKSVKERLLEIRLVQHTWHFRIRDHRSARKFCRYGTTLGLSTLIDLNLFLHPKEIRIIRSCNNEIDYCIGNVIIPMKTNVMQQDLCFFQNRARDKFFLHAIDAFGIQQIDNVLLLCFNGHFQELRLQRTCVPKGDLQNFCIWLDALNQESRSPDLVAEVLSLILTKRLHNCCSSNSRSRNVRFGCNTSKNISQRSQDFSNRLSRKINRCRNCICNGGRRGSSFTNSCQTSADHGWNIAQKAGPRRRYRCCFAKGTCAFGRWRWRRPIHKSWRHCWFVYVSNVYQWSESESWPFEWPWSFSESSRRTRETCKMSGLLRGLPLGLSKFNFGLPRTLDTSNS